jgi:predicted phosphodiesterase
LTNIILISDTHSFHEEALLKHLPAAHELWHAGDIGTHAWFEPISKQFPHLTIRAVYGNIDDAKTRLCFPETNIFYCEHVKVYMTHIGGYPDHYAKGIKEKLLAEKPLLFVCGHSHILRVIYDKKIQTLHMNPGAIGEHGFHQVKTCLSFSIHHDQIQDLKIIEFGKRGSLSK